MKRTFLTLLAFLLALSAIGANFASDEQTLRAFDRELAIATYLGNANWFRTHLADDYVLITSSGVMKTKDQLIAQLEKHDPKLEPYEPTEVTIRAHGSTAIVSGRILQKYTAAGERVIADLRYSDVWIRTDEGWFNISGQVSPVSIKREKIK